ncbi:ATP-binding protein [Rhodocaloribacter litoris]|uniref:ATP-binding protein n=1 Tax=Rhodocaloribacter litoris TaxID=2558931 RepID=UPI00141E65FC|nr:ATP-binding protein [Rhodocaloribacter litoris]QXD15102.1 ATP-binding protein [Rhodocaloribacter litoris]
MIPRHITSELLAALSDTPVVFINGARQTGKSTLARQIAEEAHPARYLTLDDATVLAAAESDPSGFIRSLETPVVLDEVQRVPSLFRALKLEIDRNRRPGRFMLTGSADVLLLPNVSESLAGRMEVLTLWPFSQGELERTRETFIDRVFSGTLPGDVPPLTQPDDLWTRVLRGGYPEVVQRASAQRRRAWFNAYLTTILQRDVRDLAHIEGLTQLPHLLALLAARATGLLNYAEVSRSSGLPLTTLRRYMSLLEATFLIQTLPAWHANLGKRLVKTPKLLISDTGLLAHLIGLYEPEDLRNHPMQGALLENFVAMELRKQITWSERKPTLYHFRLQTGREVDLVLEDARQRLVGLEVKAASSVSNTDLKGLRALREARPETFVRGIVLYQGEAIVGFEPDLYAVPLQALWHW